MPHALKDHTQEFRLIAPPKDTGPLYFLKRHNIAIANHRRYPAQIFLTIHSLGAMDVIGAYREWLAPV